MLHVGRFKAADAARAAGDQLARRKNEAAEVDSASDSEARLLLRTVRGRAGRPTGERAIAGGSDKRYQRRARHVLPLCSVSSGRVADGAGVRSEFPRGILRFPGPARLNRYPESSSLVFQKQDVLRRCRYAVIRNVGNFGRRIARIALRQIRGDSCFELSIGSRVHRARLLGEVSGALRSADDFLLPGPAVHGMRPDRLRRLDQYRHTDTQGQDRQAARPLAGHSQRYAGKPDDLFGLQDSSGLTRPRHCQYWHATSLPRNNHHAAVIIQVAKSRRARRVFLASAWPPRRSSAGNGLRMAAFSRPQSGRLFCRAAGGQASAILSICRPRRPRLSNSDPHILAPHRFGNFAI